LPSEDAPKRGQIPRDDWYWLLRGEGVRDFGLSAIVKGRCCGNKPNRSNFHRSNESNKKKKKDNRIRSETPELLAGSSTVITGDGR